MIFKFRDGYIKTVLAPGGEVVTEYTNIESNESMLWIG